MMERVNAGSHPSEPSRQCIESLAEGKVEESDKSTQQNHSNKHNDSGIIKLFVLSEAFLFGIPRPCGFAELDDDFVPVSKNATHDDRDVYFIGTVHLASKKVAGQEGLEPPTDGFGDRYSTN